MKASKVKSNMEMNYLHSFGVTGMKRRGDILEDPVEQEEVPVVSLR